MATKYIFIANYTVGGVSNADKRKLTGFSYLRLFISTTSILD